MSPENDITDETSNEMNEEPSTKLCKLDVTATNENNNKDCENNIEDNAENTTDNLSKRQMKKLQKLAQWEIKKKEKRTKEREKNRQKRLAAIAAGEPTRIGPSRKALKHNKMDDSSNPFTIAIDLDYDDLMIDKDICKCAKQLLWVYTINRKAVTPLHVYYTGLKDKGRLYQALDRNDGYKNWDIKIMAEPYIDIFPKEKIVYLTSDSDEVLNELDKDSVYVIGGLVDHNHHKGISLKRASELGLRTARLPLGENVSLKTRTVLTIVHGKHFKFLLKTNQQFCVFFFIFSFRYFTACFGRKKLARINFRCCSK